MPPASRGCLRRLRLWTSTSNALLFRRFASTQSATALTSRPGPPIKIRLREYQEECIQAVLSHLEKGHKRLGVSLATGAGKTVIFTQLIDRVPSREETADQTLILAHRQELVEQAARHCVNAYPTKRVEIEMGNMKASGFADITVASVQSIVSGDRMSKFDPSRFKLVLVDEAHHIVAPGYMKTLAHFGLAEPPQGSSPALVGVSATLSRFDGLRLGAAIDQIVYHKDYIDMIGENWLSNVIFTTVQSKADISKVKRGANRDFQPGELSRIVNTEQINDITVRSWIVKADGRKSTLVFCVDLEHVSGLTKTFRRHGIDAHFVTGDTPKVERSNRLDSFKRGEFPVLVNCGVFTEGTDIPNIDCVLLARPTKSRNLLVQMIGRGMRLHPGKKDCHVIDMVASLETGIVTTPTLFGLDPSEVIEGANVDDMKSLSDCKEAERQREEEVSKMAKTAITSSAPVSRIVSFTDYDSVFDLIEDTSGERHIRVHSPHAWVNVADGRYILSHTNGSYLRLQKDTNDEGKDEFIVTETSIFPAELTSGTPYRRPRQIARAVEFADAIHAADTYAAKKYPFHVISRNQAWRNRPATDGQIKFLNKLRPKDDQLIPETVTKGKAGDMITKIKHGARGRFAGLTAMKKRASRLDLKKEQEKELKQREKVSVGPLLY